MQQARRQRQIRADQLTDSLQVGLSALQLAEQERLRTVGQMAAGIAHDFNNALAPIVGFSELLLNDPEKRANQELLVKWLQHINTSASDAAKVVRQIREFGKQTSNNLSRTPIDLNQLIQQIIEITKPCWKDQAQSTGNTINIDTDLESIPTLLGEEYALREVLTNLIFNAVDFMPNGGTIILGTAVDGDFIRLWVSDTGIGMTEEVREHCFEPFFTTKGPQGTGLGLALVQSIAQRHGGTVTVESEPGKGTTITLRLPIPVAIPVADTPIAVPAISRPLHVLLVDDEPLIIKLVTIYLTDAGHTVATAKNGVAALELLKASRFDLVLTDKAMPEMNGEQLAVAIQATYPSLPVIMMTGFGDLIKANNERPPYISGILSKPLTQLTLRAALAEVFPPQAT
ncbi:MAG: ATP-binding protein [Desulfuromonadales bacterium]